MIKRLWDCSASNTTSTTTSITSSTFSSTVSSTTTITATTTTSTTTTTTTTLVGDTATGCNGQSDTSMYHYNSTYNLCFYYDSVTHNYITWSDSYDFCRSINGSMLILDTDEKLQFARSIQAYQNIWVGLYFYFFIYHKRIPRKLTFYFKMID